MPGIRRFLTGNLIHLQGFFGPDCTDSRVLTTLKVILKSKPEIVFARRETYQIPELEKALPLSQARKTKNSAWRPYRPRPAHCRAGPGPPRSGPGLVKGKMTGRPTKRIQIPDSRFQTSKIPDIKDSRHQRFQTSKIPDSMNSDSRHQRSARQFKPCATCRMSVGHPARKRLFSGFAIALALGRRGCLQGAVSPPIILKQIARKRARWRPNNAEKYIIYHNITTESNIL